MWGIEVRSKNNIILRIVIFLTFLIIFLGNAASNGVIVITDDDYTVDLAPISATNTVGTEHTVTATVMQPHDSPFSEPIDDPGPFDDPGPLDVPVLIDLQGINVQFEVISGPNAGKSGNNVTDSNGEAMFTYTDTGASSGTDYIKATATIPTSISLGGTITPERLIESNVVEKTWVEQNDIPEFPTIALPVVAIFGLAFFFQRRKN